MSESNENTPGQMSQRPRAPADLLRAPQRNWTTQDSEAARAMREPVRLSHVELREHSSELTRKYKLHFDAVWRHKKSGCFYLVCGLAYIEGSPDLDMAVIYKPSGDVYSWSRPIREFLEKFEFAYASALDYAKAEVRRNKI